MGKVLYFWLMEEKSEKTIKAKPPKYRGLKDIPSHETTPFVELSNFEWIKTNPGSSSRNVADMETGEVLKLSESQPAKVFYVDNRKYVKLFVEDVPDVDQLSHCGARLWKWLVKNLAPGKEEIYIHPPRVSKELGYKSSKVVYSAIGELCNIKLLARKTGTGVYFINPEKMFNGSRLSLMESEARKTQKSELYNKMP